MRYRPEQHLRRQSDIREVREKGRRVDCRAFTVWWKYREPITPEATKGNPMAHPSRVCVIASTSAVGNAVARNRAKRRLREIFRQHQDLVPPACDLLLIARSGAKTWDWTELEKRFGDACRQIGTTRRQPPPHS